MHPRAICAAALVGGAVLAGCDPAPVPRAVAASCPRAPTSDGPERVDLDTWDLSG